MWEITVSIGFLAVLALVTDRRTRPVVVIAYLIRMVMAYVHAYVVPLPDSQFDAIRFERVAWMWARDGQCFDKLHHGIPPVLVDRKLCVPDGGTNGARPAVGKLLPSEH